MKALKFIQKKARYTKAIMDCREGSIGVQVIKTLAIHENTPPDQIDPAVCNLPAPNGAYQGEGLSIRREKRGKHWTITRSSNCI